MRILGPGSDGYNSQVIAVIYLLSWYLFWLRIKHNYY